MIEIMMMIVLVWFDYDPVNSYGHVGMVSLANHTFFPGQA